MIFLWIFFIILIGAVVGFELAGDQMKTAISGGIVSVIGLLMTIKGVKDGFRFIFSRDFIDKYRAKEELDSYWWMPYAGVPILLIGLVLVFRNI